MTGRLLGVHVFGSVARGDRDATSDLDLLAVVADGEGKVPEADVLLHIPPGMAGPEPSVSWYGQRRLAAMFANGELFAWHLHLEARSLFEPVPTLRALGEPAPYRDAALDVASFESILAAVPPQLDAAPENALYEMGLVYVCLRNIAMAASWALLPRPDFTRHSPFRLAGVAPLPLTRAEYDLAMACRMAGQRGVRPPATIDRSRVIDVHARLLPWIASLRVRLEKG